MRSSVRVRGGALVPVLCLWLLAGCRDTQPAVWQEVLLGTVCTLTLYGPVDEDVVNGMFDVVQVVQDRMSGQDEHSEVSRVNRASGVEPVAVSVETYEVVRRGLEYAELTGGAFDISVGPLVRLWGIGTETARVPSEEEIRHALDLVDYRDVILDPATHSVYLRRAGMALDLGGIAKGYAADQAAAYLRERGVKQALLDFGGNLYTVGNPPGRALWRIGIQDPEQNRGASLAVIRTGPTSVVTSGVYERYFESGGVRYHHILDTTTGYPARGVLSSTVVSPTSMDADALSTSLFVLGPERGLKLAEAVGVEAMVVTDDKRVRATPGLREILTVTNPSYTLVDL